MKKFCIDKKHKDEVEKWLLENIGSPFFRWWIDDHIIFNLTSIKSPEKSTITVNLDLTEEEESLLTLFIMRWV